MPGTTTPLHSVSILVSVPKGTKGDRMLKVIAGMVKIGAVLFFGAKKPEITVTTDVDLDNNAATEDYMSVMTW